MKEVRLFDNQMVLNISEEDWNFLYQNCLFSESPAIEDIQTEFVVGTGITQNEPLLWKEADKMFSEYIQNLREIQKLDINKMIMNALSYEEKYVENYIDNFESMEYDEEF